MASGTVRASQDFFERHKAIKFYSRKNLVKKEEFY